MSAVAEGKYSPAFRLAIWWSWYALAEMAGIALTNGDSRLSVLWPSGGVLLAAVLSLGRQHLWPFFAGVVLIKLGSAWWHDVPVLVKTGFLLVSILQTLLAATVFHLLSRGRGPYTGFAHARAMMLALPSYALGGVLAGAWAVLWFPEGSWLQHGLRWMVANVIAVLVIMPLLYAARWRDLFPEGWQPRRALEALALLSMLLLQGMLFRPGMGEIVSHFQYLAFPLYIWAVVRFGFTGGMLSLLLSGVMRVGINVVEHEQLARVIADQLFLGVAAITVHVLAAYNGERRFAQVVMQRYFDNVASSGGDDFFLQLSAYLRHTLRAEAVVIAEFPGDDMMGPRETGRQARVLASSGVDLPVGSCYDRALSPCVIAELWHEPVRIPDFVRAHPHWALAEQLPDAVDYVGVALRDQQGQPVGYIGLVFNRSQQDVGFMFSLLSLCMVRAGFELERQRFERQLGIFRFAFDCAADEIYMTCDAGRIVYVNEAAARNLQYGRDELVGMPIASIDPLFPDASWSTHWQTLQQTGCLRLQSQQKRRDGTLYPTELVVTWQRMHERDMLVAFVRDVSERRDLEEQFRHSQKMEAVGRLAGGIAHDFNNLLTVIIGHADIMAMDGGPQRSRAQLVASSARRASDLTRQLLTYSRRQEMRPQQVSLVPLLQGMRELLEHMVSESIQIKWQLASSCRVRVDVGLFEQVMMNLVVNASDAMPAGGTLLIGCEDRMDERGDGLHLQVCVYVQDTGTGMTPEVRSHLFEPFFTTKGVGKGTGLGLSTVYGIVVQSGGDIRVYSEPGQGSRFEVLFPAAMDAPTGRDRERSAV